MPRHGCPSAREGRRWRPITTEVPNEGAWRIAKFVSLLASLASAAALAQTPDLEPGVQTSAPAAPAPAAAPAAGTRCRAAAKAPAPAPASRRSGSGAPAAAAQAVHAGGKSNDRIQLDTTQISGNRELPKVMYVVPWRRADPGEFAGKPPNSLLDEALTPVDRDVFQASEPLLRGAAGGCGRCQVATWSRRRGRGAESKDEK